MSKETVSSLLYLLGISMIFGPLIYAAYTLAGWPILVVFGGFVFIITAAVVNDL